MNAESTPAVPPAPPHAQPWTAPVAPPPPPSVSVPAPQAALTSEPGPQVPAPGRRAVLPWTVAAVAVVVALACAGALVLTGSDDDGAGGAGAGAAGGERGFATPEAAVTYLAERVAAGDLGGAFEAFAVESIVDGYSFEAEAERLGGLSPVTWLPADSPGYRALNTELRRGEIASQLRSLVRAVAAPDRNLDVFVDLEGGTTASDVAAALATDRLDGFRVVRADLLVLTMRPGADPDRNPFVLAAEAIGADELQEVAVLYETPGGLVVGGAQVVRYGNDWYLRSLTSALIGTSIGELTPTSQLEYEALVASINR